MSILWYDLEEHQILHIHQKFQESATKRSRDMSVFVKSFQKSVNRIRIAFSSREEKCLHLDCHGCIDDAEEEEDGEEEKRRKRR